jgi:hypothetical protein
MWEYSFPARGCQRVGRRALCPSGGDRVIGAPKSAFHMEVGGGFLR